MDDLQRVLHSLDERIEFRVQAIRGERSWWPCQRGCDYCCRHLAHPPELSSVEWQRVDDAVVRLPISERAIVEERIDGLLQQITEGTTSSEVICPYLNEQEGACRIYASRPISCRTYGFFVARTHDQYCQQIEAEVNQRGDDTIAWGNAEAIRNDIAQISGSPISFERHYCDRICITDC